MHIFSRKTNQIPGLIRFSREYLEDSKPSQQIMQIAKNISIDSTINAIFSLAACRHDSIFLKETALDMTFHKIKHENDKNNLVKCVGNKKSTYEGIAIASNSLAVNDLYSFPVQFGFAGKETVAEINKSVYFPVVIAIAQLRQDLKPNEVLKLFILLEQIKNTLANNIKIDPEIDCILGGSIASAVLYALNSKMKDEEIERGIGLYLQHYFPFMKRTDLTRLPEKLVLKSALSLESALLAQKRARCDSFGQLDCFRSKNSSFRRFIDYPENESPFDLNFVGEDKDSILKTHFKFGVYPLQAAGSIHALLSIFFKERKNEDFWANKIDKLITKIHPFVFNSFSSNFDDFPTNYDEAAVSFKFVLAVLLDKAFLNQKKLSEIDSFDKFWVNLIITPVDLIKGLENPKLREMFGQIKVDIKDPEIIVSNPLLMSSKVIVLSELNIKESEIIHIPFGHALNEECDVKEMLVAKFEQFSISMVSKNKIAYFQNWFTRSLKIDEFEGKDFVNYWEAPIPYQKLEN